MARGIEIPLIADVAQFIRPIRDAGEAVADLADVFDETSDAADETGRRIDDAMTDAARSSEDAADRVDQSWAGVGGGAEKAADEFEAAGRAADDAADRVDTSMSDAARSSEGAADRVERSWKEALDELRDRARKLDREDVKVDVDVDTDRPRRKLDGFKDDLKASANQSGQEIAGTFTAGFDAENIADGITEILGESTENLSGPMQVAGLTVAAAFALAYGELSKLAEKINEAKIEAGEMAVEMGQLDDEGKVDALRGRFDELSSTLVDVRSWFEVWQDDAVTSIEAIAGATRAGTLDARAFGEAFYETDPTERLERLRDVQESLNEKLDEAGSMSFWEKLGASAAASEGMTSAQEDLTRAMSDQVQISEDAREVLDELVAQQEAAVEIERAQAEAAGLSVEAYRAQQEQLEATTAAQEGFQQAIEDTADPVSTYQGLLDEKNEAERAAAEATAAATKDSTDSWEDYAKAAEVSVDDLVNEWDRQTRRAAKFEDNLATIAESGGQALADELRAKGPQVAGAVAEVIAEAGPRKRQRAIDAHARATGRDMSREIATGMRSAGRALQSALNTNVRSLNPPAVNVPVYADTSSAVRTIDQLRYRGGTIYMDVVARRTGGFYP